VPIRGLSLSQKTYFCAVTGDHVAGNRLFFPDFLFRPFDKLRTGSGRVEAGIYFVRLRSEAAQTNEMPVTFGKVSSDSAAKLHYQMR
jgi:hypothetical protein